jgi:hypothetical protein
MSGSSWGVDFEGNDSLKSKCADLIRAKLKEMEGVEEYFLDEFIK